ncbi:MAG: hypothetical protein ACYC3O_11105 [Burkholderiales bacterium]
MKLLALFLLLINFLVFFWIEWGQTGGQPMPAEIHPEKISLIPQAGEGHSAAAPKPVTASAVSSAITPPDKPVTPAANPSVPAKNAVLNAAQKNPAPSNVSCLNWGPIPAKRADDAQAHLLKFKLGNRLSYTDDATTRSGPYWVYFPPLPTKLAADAKLSELQGLGLKDIAVVRTGPWKNAISMGLYSREPIADARVADAAKKGVTAKIDARGAANRTYTLSNLTPDEHSALLTMQENFGGPAFKKTTCPAP